MKNPNEINILIACEESQRTCTEFRKLGFNAFSADIQECSGGHPEWHILGDVLPILGGNCEFVTENGDKHKISGKWDLIIAHPPCTNLCASGLHWFSEKKKGKPGYKDPKLIDEGAEFFMKFVNADCDHIAIENPVGIMSSRYRKPDQYIQPYEFGDPDKKKTGIWLKGLPLLTPTNIVEPETIPYKYSDGSIRYYGKGMVRVKGNRGKTRSKTYLGIAKAWATQWGDFLLKESEK